jgi:hypothetical protein
MLESQGRGLTIVTFLLLLLWLFAVPAQLRFPGVEMPDFYPIFLLFLSWLGITLLVFLGFLSIKFRKAFMYLCFRKVRSVKVAFRLALIMCWFLQNGYAPDAPVSSFIGLPTPSGHEQDSDEMEYEEQVHEEWITEEDDDDGEEEQEEDEDESGEETKKN